MNKKLLPLALLDATDEEAIEGITRFQKLVFLTQKERLDTELYPFSAGKYGPFSKSLYDDVDRLVEEGFVEKSTKEHDSRDKNDTQVYRLEEKGERAIKNGLDETDMSIDDIEDFVTEYNNMGLWDLLEYVYGEYPKMAENSKLDI